MRGKENKPNMVWLKKTIKKLYGKKCPDYYSSCPVCDAYQILETIQQYNDGKL